MNKDETPDVPKPTGGDKVHASARALIGSVPGVGALGVELFSWFVKAPLERRRDEWMHEVAELLRRLQEDFGFDLAALQENESFVDTVMQVTHVAMRNRQSEKREALCNALLNSALPDAPDESLQQMFLHWIDVFTPWHLRLLKLFDNPKKAFEERSLDSLESNITCSLSHVLDTVYSELREKREIYDQFWRELNAAGLVNTDSLHTSMSGGGTMQRRTTELGQIFLAFVTDPSTG